MSDAADAGAPRLGAESAGHRTDCDLAGDASIEGGSLGSHCIVVGCDRSRGAKVAAEWAASQLGAGGTLVLVHACRSLLRPPSVLSTPEERIEIGHAVLDDLLMEAGAPLLDVEVEVQVLDEDPVSAILEVAGSHEAAAIVIGSEHRSRLRSAIGTLTEELLKRSSVPVVSVPGPVRAAAS